MYYLIRVMPTIYLSYDLPSDIKNEDEAIAYLSAIAKDKQCLAWFSLSRRETVFIDKVGEVTGRHEFDFHDTILPYLPF